MSEILNFGNYAEYSLATKMAKSSDEVVSFLNDLKIKAIKKSKKEIRVLENFARKKLNIKKLNPWDLAYVAEKYKEEKILVFLRKNLKIFPLKM